MKGLNNYYLGKSKIYFTFKEITNTTYYKYGKSKKSNYQKEQIF